jgi:hypothetical protein
MSKKLRRKRLRQLWNIKLRSRNPWKDDVEENSAYEDNLIAFANGFSSGAKTRTKSN